MVGGKIHEIIALPGRLWVNVVDRPYGKDEFCAIYVEATETALKMAPGDSFWWQMDKAYWTPKSAVAEDSKEPYDIPIPRIGYSGVSRPSSESTAENAVDVAEAVV